MKLAARVGLAPTSLCGFSEYATNHLLLNELDLRPILKIPGYEKYATPMGLEPITTGFVTREGADRRQVLPKSTSEKSGGN